jgi:hypothetical protein
MPFGKEKGRMLPFIGLKLFRHVRGKERSGRPNRYRASWAIIRQWVGYDDAIDQQEAQIQLLERLVLDAIYALQKAGLDDEANRLRRALQKN